MKRLHLTVEGQTEAAFSNAVLRPHLAGFNVMLGRPAFTGPEQRRGGRIPRGGMFNTFHHVQQNLHRWMQTDKDPDARFSMMVDLYHLPHDTPGYERAMAGKSCWQQAEIFEDSLANALADPRFIPYFQVHEFEALVLVEPQRLTMLYDVSAAVIRDLSDECAARGSPEEVNHGQHSHPKARIKSAVPEHDENVAGPLLAESVGLATLRERCRHFHEWLVQLEQLDQAAGVASLHAPETP